MQILFGPDHDAAHIEPDAPNGYEWWYFDALSADGRYAMVAIFFHGTPMSPYYKLAVDGRDPLPRDWCGVFFSLHEKIGARWRERAYAYNLHRNGRFSKSEPRAEIGASRMEMSSDGETRLWRIALDEPGLWRGRIGAQLTFRFAGDLPSEPLPAAAADHYWVCVAPACDVEGAIHLPGAGEIPFDGTGYHDHNFGRLPWRDMRAWYWARAHFPEPAGARTAVLYFTPDADRLSHRLLFGPSGSLDLRAVDRAPLAPAAAGNAYGLRHAAECAFGDGRVIFEDQAGVFSEGPFYRRMSVTFHYDGREARGIGEVFEPSRLCGPIASRAVWTRMRRRT